MFDLEDASYQQNADLFHQAGYDAYQTGYAFLKMIYYLSKLSRSSLPATALANTGFFSSGSQNAMSFDENSGFLSSPQLKEYINIIHIMRSDPPMMRLDAEDTLPDRRNVFFLYDFPKEWKRSHILDAFKDFNTLDMKWVGKTEVRVVVDRECVNDIMEAIEHNETRPGKQYSICSDEQYRAKRDSHGT